MTQKFYNDLTHSIVGAAIEVHEELGPGLLEGVYEKCMVHLLTCKGFKIMNQQRIPVRFKESFLDCDLRYDLLVEDSIIVEIKAAEKILPIYEAQLMTYLKLLKKAKGIILNFNCCNIFYEGQKTIVTKEFMNLPRGY
ncbi:MAG: GxxExxY protein [Syntrophothermus sp.]